MTFLAGTRGSKLAWTQTGHALAELARRLPDAPPSFLPPDPDLAAARLEVLAAIAAME